SPMLLNSSGTWRVLNCVAASVAAFVSTLLVDRIVLSGVILVTVGQFTLERIISLRRLSTILMQAEDLHPILLPAAVLIGCTTGVLVFLRSRRAHLSTSAARRQFLFWLSTMAGVALVASSYRFFGMLFVLLALLVQLRNMSS